MEECTGGLGFRQGRYRVRTEKWEVFGLKQGNVATFGCNVAMFQRGNLPRCDVRGNVATFQRMVIINVATLDINVATFQRGVKSTSRCYREGLIQRRDMDIQRRDVPGKGQIDVATLKCRDVETSRR